MAEEDGPLGRTGHVACTSGSFMVVWGGYREDDERHGNVYFRGSEIWVYHALSERWSMRTCHGDDIPPGTSGAVAVFLKNSVYIFGGYQDKGNTNDLYRLNLSDFSWELLHPSGCVPTPLDKLVGWEHDSKLYFFGGFGMITQNHPTEQPPFDYVFESLYNMNPTRGWTNQFIAYDPRTNEWTVPATKGRMPVPRAAHAAALLNNKVYIFGGRHQNTRLNDLHYLDMDSMEWSGPLFFDSCVPEGRSWHSLSALPKNNTLVLYGGFSHHDVPLSDCWILDINIMTWIKVDLTFHKPRLWHSACVNIFDEILIFGGCTGNILDHRINSEHAKDIIVLNFSPKSLFRLCVDVVGKNAAVYGKCFHILPSEVQNLLQHRIGTKFVETSLEYVIC